MTFILPTKRRRWFVDFDGIRTTSKLQDEKLIETFDFSDVLSSGETISSVAWEAQGVTISNESNTTTTATLTVTGNGMAKVTLTTSTGQEIQEQFRWMAKDAVHSDYSDYCG